LFKRKGSKNDQIWARACLQNKRPLFLALFSLILEIFLGNIRDIGGEIFQESKKKSSKKPLVFYFEDTP
jgi:hypothetical protein